MQTLTSFGLLSEQHQYTRFSFLNKFAARGEQDKCWDFWTFTYINIGESDTIRVSKRERPKTKRHWPPYRGSHNKSIEQRRIRNVTRRSIAKIDKIFLRTRCIERRTSDDLSLYFARKGTKCYGWAPAEIHTGLYTAPLNPLSFPPAAPVCSLVVLTPRSKQALSTES